MKLSTKLSLAYGLVVLHVALIPGVLLLKTGIGIYPATLAACLVGLIGVLILSQIITRPIRELAKGMEQVTQGKLDTEIRIKSNDEVGALARMVNGLTGKLGGLDKKMNDFVSSVTHELRSPLASIKMYIDLFFKGAAGKLNKTQEEYFTIMKNSAERLGRLIDNVLDLSKIESGRIEIKKKPFDLKPVALDVMELIRPQAYEKKIDLKLKLPKGLPKALGDPDGIKQVFTNLLSNAIKFTPQHGKVTVEVKDIKFGFLEITVADSGVGIPKDKLDKVFEKFEQVEETKKYVKGIKGTGLGLAIAKAIVENQGGKIWIESEMKQGTKFIFTLPRHG